jgi:hypothetical protein
MVKAFSHKAESFNSFCKAMPTISNPIKEACFDMQMVFVSFLEEAIKCLRDDGEIGYHGRMVQELIPRGLCATRK